MDIPGIDYPRRHDDERRQEEIQALEDRIKELEDNDERLRLDLAMRLEQVQRLVTERDHYRFEAERKIFVRQELADLLNTEDVGEAVRMLRDLKRRAGE
ncbi:MAG: hypothetical protein ACLGIN_14690 [Candidatus Sericytochromatia bacterium]